MKIAETPILGQISSNLIKAMQNTIVLTAKCQKKIILSHEGKKQDFRDQLKEM